VRLLLVSEGVLDVGTTVRAGAAHEGSEDRRGAVSVLVRRLLEQKFGRDIHDWEMESAVLPRVHARSEAVSGYPRKVHLAIQEAAARGCTSVAIVVDRDRTEGGSRLAELRAGRDLAEERGEPPARKIEDPERLGGGPRSDTYPKNVFRELLGRAKAPIRAPYDEVAERARLDLLERRCKAGFAPFAEEIRERCE